MENKEDVLILTDVSETRFQMEIYPKRVPTVIRGVDLGDCCEKWTAEYLMDTVGDRDVKVHVSTDSKMDFLQKNFHYKTLPFSKLVERASQRTNANYFVEPNEFYYLRSLGLDPRGKDVADIKRQYPQLAKDLKVPQYFPEEAFFSSVFRIGSAGIQLWTHYDIMDNILMQIRGRKRVVLYNPEDALNLYLNGDKSEVTDIDDPDLDRFPRFARAKRYECHLQPGDILFIPALWFHNVTSLDFGVAVNVFWKHLDEAMYDRKDTYGNKDLVPATLAFSTLDKVLKQLETLPEDYKAFYARRMISKIENKLGLAS